MLDWLFSKPLDPGTEAPDFTLPDENNRPVTLSKLRGRHVVLVFYPGDDTLVCRRQLCELRDNWARLRDGNISVFGINPQSAESHRAFRAKYTLPFPLLVDKGKQVASLYRAAGPIIRRTVYVISPEGRIVYARRGKPSPAEVLAQCGAGPEPRA